MEDQDLPIPTLTERFNHLLNSYRDEQGRQLTIFDVAAFGSVKVDTLQKLARGKYTGNLTIETLSTLCRAFNVLPWYFMEELWTITEFHFPPPIPGRRSPPSIRVVFHTANEAGTYDPTSSEPGSIRYDPHAMDV